MNAARPHHTPVNPVPIKCAKMTPGKNPTKTEEMVKVRKNAASPAPSRVASAEDAQEVCQAVRGALAEISDDATAASVRVLYGGSVNAKNVGDIVGRPDVDGALVGGASLTAEEFASIVRFRSHHGR